MWESPFNKVTRLQVCNFTKKGLQHRRFPVNIGNFKNTYFEKHLRRAAHSSYILHRKNWIRLFRNQIGLVFPNLKSLYFTYSHSYSSVLSLAFIRCQSLSFFVTCCQSLSLVVISCHLLYHSLLLVVTRCTARCHLLPFVVPLVINSLSLVVEIVVTPLPFVVTRCTTRLSFYKQSIDFHWFKFFFAWVVYCRLRLVSLLFHKTRSSRSQMFFKIGAFKSFAIFTGKHKC